MSATIPLWTSAVITLVVTSILYFRRMKGSWPSYPPGPEPRLFVGNLFDLPVDQSWKAYRDLGKIYGDMLHFQVFGQHIVVLNSENLADRLLEQRSRIYSDRPFVPMAELMGWSDINTGMLRYGPDWRMHRKIYTQGFRSTVVPKYQPIISSKTSQLLSNLRQSPNLFINHVKTYAAAAILATVYGYDVLPSNDSLRNITEEANKTFMEAIHPSAAMVNILPFLRHLPLEFPVFAFQRIARRTRALLDEMRIVPYNFVKNNMAEGKGGFSLLAKLLQDHAVNGGTTHQERLIRDALTSAYSAGADTTSSTLLTFFLAMALHPEIQKRAQRELDTVIGKGRLPTFEDRSELPYIEAILCEILRWAPAGPLGGPHVAFSDDTLDGYFIPKGTIIFSNIWAMTRNEDVFAEPETFSPERFLTEDGRCNRGNISFAFGFGRRICPGRHFAILTVWMAMTSILSNFEIGEPEDETGKAIKSLADAKYSHGAVSHPNDFRCVVKPRIGVDSIETFESPRAPVLNSP